MSTCQSEFPGQLGIDFTWADVDSRRKKLLQQQQQQLPHFIRPLALLSWKRQNYTWQTKAYYRRVLFGIRPFNFQTTNERESRATNKANLSETVGPRTLYKSRNRTLGWVKKKVILFLNSMKWKVNKQTNKIVGVGLLLFVVFKQNLTSGQNNNENPPEDWTQVGRDDVDQNHHNRRRLNT